MRVNGKDLKNKYKNVVWLNQTINSRKVLIHNQWLDSGNNIKYKENQYQDFDIYLDFIVKGDSKEQCELTMSELMNEFDAGIIELDGMNFLYKFDFKDEKRELIKRWEYHYEITLTGYEKMGIAEEIEIESEILKFTAKGTLPAPIYMRFISPSNTLKISGLTEDTIILNNLSLGSTVIIDAEKGIITENGQNIVEKIELWEFPKVIGNITITFSEKCQGKLTYNPRYK